MLINSTCLAIYAPFTCLPRVLKMPKTEPFRRPNVPPQPQAERRHHPNTGSPSASATTVAASVTGTAKRKHHIRRGGGGSPTGGAAKGGKSKGGGVTEETAEQHAAKNLEIFEGNLAALRLPKGVIGNGAGGGR